MKSPIFCKQSEQAFSLLRDRLSCSTAPPQLIGIGGPGGSGKSLLSRWLRDSLPGCGLLSLDDFRLPRHRRPAHAPFGSHPDAVDLPRLTTVLQAARQGDPVEQPVFDRATGEAAASRPLAPARLWLIDGEITAYPHLDDWLDLRILVQSSLLTQLNTRLQRDRSDRSCSLRKTLHIFMRSNLLDHPRHARGVQEKAHLIFHRHPRKGLVLKQNRL